jgi:hypothetical protein
MTLNQDKVPSNLEEAVQLIKDGLSVEDIQEIQWSPNVACRVHLTVGMFIRNEWSLWEKDTVLVKWFKNTYGIDHADDVSGIILDCACRDIQKLPRRDKELAERYRIHWIKMGKT